MKALVSILKKILKYFANNSNQKTINFKHGKNFYSNSIIDVLTPEFIEIGENFISAPGSIILSHDASLLSSFGVYRVEKTIIGNNVFLGANSVILPGITIGHNVIIGALSVVTKDVPSGVVVAGNPAKILCKVDEYYEKCKKENILYISPTMLQILSSNGNIDAGAIKKIKSELTNAKNNSK